MISGHLWTIGPRLAHSVRRKRLVEREPWSVEVADSRWGSLRLTGWWHRATCSRDQGSREQAPREDGCWALLVHGLGGSTASHYVAPAVSTLVNAGFDVLALNLRGGDRSGEDVYHAGLVEDVASALASPGLGSRPAVLCGVSLGGHVVLRAAALGVAPNIRAAVAVCSPLDLAASQRAIDRSEAMAGVYRRYLLRNLIDHVSKVVERGRIEVDLDEIRRARTIRRFDELVVVPRFGFTDPEDYYAAMSVAPRLAGLAVPALLVAAEHDPIVTAAAVRGAVTAPLEVAWAETGGHAGFPATLDLGLGGPPGLWPQVASWLRRSLG
jgi:predicted alpha/beta-fold hydrolase